MVEHARVMTEEQRRPPIVLAVGGTIAMQGDSALVALDAAALTSGLAVDARTLLGLPGVQLSLDDALSVAREAAREAETRGVVVTTGTDTLEELAVLTDVLHAGPHPIVFTGAIRPASAAGADGPANLTDAVAVASQAPAATYVVFAGEIHAAREARKNDSTSPRAFSSPRTGPLGYVAEHRISLLTEQVVRPQHLVPQSLAYTVPIVETFLGDEGTVLDALIGTEIHGLVLVALGAGHVSPKVLERIPRDVPVVACVRPERGALLHETYGFHGAEGDLRAAGVIPAATVSPQAARMRLLAALGAEADPFAALSDLA